MLSSEAQRATLSRRFIVSWRNRVNTRTSPVGELSQDSLGYRFTYLPGAPMVEGFRPFIAFPEFDREYRSTRLWAFFALRVMDPHRPDYLRYLKWLGLEPGVSLLDVLSRSGGERKGDSVQLIERPTVAPDGSTSSVFLARGARYATKQHGSTLTVDALREGDSLGIRVDPANPANSEALYLTDVLGTPFGWVPDMLIRYVRSVVSANGHLTVLRNNGPECPWHLRILVEVRGNLPPNFEPFPVAVGVSPTVV